MKKIVEDYKPNYKWNLTDLQKVKKNGLKVFSCFACGGGSTMGYKLAGFDVIGANDIDPEMAWHYKENHKPKHYFLEDIRTFRLRNDLPEELFNLDILDGSPPCSSFSMAGSREKGWGKKKKFREGQSKQTLDDLFFEFIELAKKLKPKIIIAENVKGLIQGNARIYVKEIFKALDEAGYQAQLFLLNAASMGVPQKRERVFFICRRKDLILKPLTLEFNEKVITLGEAFYGLEKDLQSTLTGGLLKRWQQCALGAFARAKSGNTFGFMSKESPRKPAQTVIASPRNYRWDIPRHLNNDELCLVGSFPMDYAFKVSPGYMIGMSVPPLMTYGVAKNIHEQWLADFKEVKQDKVIFKVD